MRGPLPLANRIQFSLKRFLRHTGRIRTVISLLRSDRLMNRFRCDPRYPVRAECDGLRPFRPVEQGNARNSEVKRFLLDSTRVRQNFAGMPFHGKHFQITERWYGPKFSIERNPGGVKNTFSSRMNRKKYRIIEFSDSFQYSTQPISTGPVFSASDRQQVEFFGG